MHKAGKIIIQQILYDRVLYNNNNYTGMFPVGDTSCRTLIAVCVCVCPPTYS